MSKQRVSFMTFNMLSHKDKKKYPWDKRKIILENLIDMYEPDIICAQECWWPYQASYLLQRCNQYKLTNCSKGSTGVQIFYKDNLFELKDKSIIKRGDIKSHGPSISGKFAFCKNPETIFSVFTTHFVDGNKSTQRLNSSKLLWSKIEKMANNTNKNLFFLMGDFNAEEEEDGVEYQYKGRKEPMWNFFISKGLSDAHVEYAIQKGMLSSDDVDSEQEIDYKLREYCNAKTTYHGFDEQVYRLYIDWILFKPWPSLTLKRFEIITYREDNFPFYPSDHYPVYAEFDVDNDRIF